jgi:hypothetical protein
MRMSREVAVVIVISRRLVVCGEDVRVAGGGGNKMTKVENGSFPTLSNWL